MKKEYVVDLAKSKILLLARRVTESGSNTDNTSSN
jgi:hypothetical protein